MQNRCSRPAARRTFAPRSRRIVGERTRLDGSQVDPQHRRAAGFCCRAADASTAHAAWPQFGVSQSFRNFGLKTDEGAYDPAKDVSKSIFWAPLQISRLRVIVPFDLAFRSESDGRRQEFQHWLARANELGAEPYVVFGPTELKTNVVDPAVYPKEVFRTPTSDPKVPNSSSPRSSTPTGPRSRNSWTPGGRGPQAT